MQQQQSQRIPYGGEAKDRACKAQHVEMLIVRATDLAGRSAARCLQLNRTEIESTYQPTQSSGKSEGMACIVCLGGAHDRDVIW